MATVSGSTAHGSRSARRRSLSEQANGGRGLLWLCLKQLRRADAWLPVSDSLGVLGVGLLVSSAALALLRLRAEHPYLLVAFFGWLCLLMAALSSRRGLVRFLPRRLLTRLFRRTPFELMFEESEVTNFIRRWARVFLLCQEHSEKDIQVILRGLDEDFLDKVFRQSAFHMLPGSIGRLLLPSDPYERQQLQLLETPAWRGNAHLSGVGSLMARCVGLTRSRSSSQDGTVLTAAGIRGLLVERTEAKRTKAKEPPLTPVLRNLVFKFLSFESVCDSLVFRFAQQGAVASASISAVIWGCGAFFFCTPMARRGLTTFSSALSGSYNRGTEEKASRIALILAALSLVGGIVSSAFAVHIKKNWLSHTTLPSTKAAVEAAVCEELTHRGIHAPSDDPVCRQSSEASLSCSSFDRRREPEKEESPENSSTYIESRCGRWMTS